MTATKPRLAIFLPGLYEGGAERIMLNLAKGLLARGHSVDLVLARAEGPYMPQIPEGVRLVDLKAPRVLGSLPALVRYLRRERPAAMISAMFTNVIALLARRLSGVPVRLVITEHNTLASVVDNKNDVRWQAYPTLAGWFYPWADVIVAVSNDVKKDLALAANISSDRIEVVYNPIVTPDLKMKSEQPLEHPWFANGGPPVVVAVGRLTDQKAFDVLIRALSIARRDRPLRLMILGEGENRPALEALIATLGLREDVRLMGFVQNPYPFMAQAAAFALPSRWEGLPTVLVEALYLGAPIVATNCPGGSRDILMGGRFGKLVSVDDPTGLAAALLKSTKETRVRPPQESWRPFESEFVVDRYLGLALGA
jgi:glycosyltransferase involved in cell wall biosynthesis